MANDNLPVVIPQRYTLSLYYANDAYIVHVREQGTGSFTHDRYKMEGDARAAYSQIICNLTNAKMWRTVSGHDALCTAYAVFEFSGTFKDIYNYENSNA